MTSKKNTSTISADDIQTLEPITHVRKRVGMYLGSASSEGMTVAIREGLDNSVDEVLGGHGDTVILRFFADGSAEVQDYGRGLPVDTDKEGVNGIIKTVATIGSGGKFSSENKIASGGLNGVGISAANAASRRFDVTVYKNKKRYELSFKEGRPGFFARPNDPDAKFTPNTTIKVSKDPRPAAEQKKHPTGTTVRMWADFTVFQPGSVFLVEELKERLKATCFLIPHMTGIIEDYRESATAHVDKYHFNTGISEMINTLTSHGFVSKPVHVSGNTSFTELTNVIKNDGSVSHEEVERPVSVDFAFAYTDAEDTIINSYVNIIQTKYHGTHVDGMWRAMSRTWINYVKENKLIKAKEDAPTLDDVRDGFVGVLSIKFPEPTYSGQSKDSLQTQQIVSLLSKEISDELKRWIADKKNQAQAKKIGQRIVEAKRIREAAKLQKETARKKSQLESSASMPAKLVECEFPGHEYAELHIAEGDSAMGTLRASRDSRYQALLPLKGKILNTQKASLSKMLENAECSAIIQVLGAGSGRSFEIDQLRYKNVLIATDSDIDGEHIRTLLITFFWNVMPELIKQGRLYATQPPLYILTTSGKNGRRYLLPNDEAKDALMKELDKKKIKYEPLQRMKGLGEMSADDFWETSLNPETRKVRRITAADAQIANRMIELAMGDKVEPRQEWIMSSREKITDEDLDV